MALDIRLGMSKLEVSGTLSKVPGIGLGMIGPQALVRMPLSPEDGLSEPAHTVGSAVAGHEGRILQGNSEASSTPCMG